MSETEQETTSMSTEDKFFGVKTQHSKTIAAPDSSEETGLELEIIDDTPPEEKKPAKEADDSDESTNYSDDLSDEELSSYSKGVQKRINQLVAKNKEKDRRVGEAQRLKDEAVRVAQLQQKKIQEYEELLAKGQGALIKSNRGKAEADLSKAESELRKAHEEGDADKLVESQKLLSQAQQKIYEMEQRETQLKRSIQAQKARHEAEAQKAAQPQPAKISPEDQQRMDNWMADNPWFQPNPQANAMQKEMTAVGLAIHDILGGEGITAERDPDRYYSEVDRRMRQRFPDYFNEGQEEQEERSTPQRQRSNTAVVAPSTNRNNGAKTRKIQLTKSQHALARTLGITPEQYAAQLMQQGAGQ